MKMFVVLDLGENVLQSLSNREALLNLVLLSTGFLTVLHTGVLGRILRQQIIRTRCPMTTHSLRRFD